MSDILIKLHTNHDEPARQTTIKYIEGVTTNSDKYGVDLLYIGGLYFNKIEVQVLTYKHFITYLDVLTVFKRKDRYDLKTLYITYNFNFTSCYVFSRSQLDPLKFMMSPARYSVRREDFLYMIEKKDVLFIKNINENTFNKDILEAFYISKNK